MSFLNQFASHFNAQERQTELYNLWSSIGVNSEKAILEELTAIITRTTDINAFDDNMLRSWLAFFYHKIPNKVCATTYAKVTNKGSTQVTIPQYSQFTIGGKTFTQMESITISPNETMSVLCYQGNHTVRTGTSLSNIMKFQAEGIDIDTIEITISNSQGTSTVNPVTFKNSYDALSYRGKFNLQSPVLKDGIGDKGAFYTVVNNGIYDFGTEESPNSVEFEIGDIVIYDGENWNKQITSNFNAVQFADDYGIPDNGYYAYYSDGYLYIKFFGISEDDVTSYSVSYMTCDGYDGSIETTDSIEYSSFEGSNDLNFEDFEVTHYNDVIGVDEPTTGKLALYLKNCLYNSRSISTIPEYTAWFKAQPEIGDCVVLSDYEKYIRGESSKYESTGIVSVYAIDTQKNPIDLNNGIATKLLERLLPKRDIAFVEFSEPEEIQNYLIFNYTSSSTTHQYVTEFIKNIASMFYEIQSLNSIENSLFDDLDLSKIVKKIQDEATFDISGLNLKGYHYKRIQLKEYAKNKSYQITRYSHEACGNGFYYLKFYKSDGTEITDKRTKFEEIETSAGTSFCNIYNDITQIGSSTKNTVTLMPNVDKSSDTAEVYLECYWSTENEIILNTGSSTGFRTLSGINVERI